MRQMESRPHQDGRHRPPESKESDSDSVGRQKRGRHSPEGSRCWVCWQPQPTTWYAHCTFPLKSKTTTPPALRPSLLAARPRPPIPRGKNASPHPLDPPLPHMTCPNASQWQQAEGREPGGMIRCIRSPLAERGLFEPRTKVWQLGRSAGGPMGHVGLWVDRRKQKKKKRDSREEQVPCHEKSCLKLLCLPHPLDQALLFHFPRPPLTVPRSRSLS
ncbi:hypothetical protein VDGL01_11957 [Verticillium dahliae]